MFWATSLDANVPAAPLVASVTASPLYTPTSAAPDVFKVAIVLALYILSVAAIPETVSVAGVMFAVVLGCVSV